MNSNKNIFNEIGFFLSGFDKKYSVESIEENLKISLSQFSGYREFDDKKDIISINYNPFSKKINIIYVSGKKTSAWKFSIEDKKSPKITFRLGLPLEDIETFYKATLAFANNFDITKIRVKQDYHPLFNQKHKTRKICLEAMCSEDRLIE